MQTPISMEVVFMVRRVLCRSSIFGLMAFVLWQCRSDYGSENLPWYAENDLNLKTKKGITYLNKMPFSGKLYTLFPNSPDTATIKIYLHGREEGLWKRNYPNGKRAEIRSFKKGKKEGLMKTFWENGRIKQKFHFKNNEYEGLCQEWSRSGVLIRSMHYAGGHESGLQQLWYENGKIRSNYLIQDGRRFGLLGTKNCINVSDSVF